MIFVIVFIHLKISYTLWYIMHTLRYDGQSQ